MGGAIALLLICYFQQKELAKLRQEVQIINEIKINESTTDSLLNKLN